MDFFKRRDPRLNHDFDEKDRALAAERKKLNTELSNMKQRHAMEEERERHELEMMRIRAEIEDLAEELAPEEEDTPAGSMNPEDVMVMKLLDKFLSSPAGVSTPAGTPPATPPASSPGGVSIPDERLTQYWAAAPANIKALAPRCSDEQIKEFVRSQIPGIDTDSQERALSIIRSNTV